MAPYIGTKINVRVRDKNTPIVVIIRSIFGFPAPLIIEANTLKIEKQVVLIINILRMAPADTNEEV